MPVYNNLNMARMAFHQLRLKKTGKNTFAKYSYFELADFLPSALQIFADNKLCATISFTEDRAIMRVVDTEDGSHCFFESPLADAQTKGSLPIQALGSAHTYMRRYLWVLALEIVEHDGIEAMAGRETPKADTISLEQANELMSLIEASGRSMDSVCDYYKIEDIHDLPASKYEHARGVLSKGAK
jgi:hypothetical protein